MEHIPVLLEEVLTALLPVSDGKYIDATLGDGGHAQSILEHSKPNGRLLGLDQDQSQLEIAQTNLKVYGDRALLVCARFSKMQEVATNQGFASVDGILMDLGISSRQLNNVRYGLTFEDSAPLDMRLSQLLTSTAADILNHSNEVELADLLYQYGDRHNSRVLARRLVSYRRKHQFTQAKDVKEALGLWHPSQLAPIFQALRIVVNQEFNELTQALPQAIALLKPGGRLAIISFHSGEDRIVKNFLRQHKDTLETPKSLVPTYAETKRNSRARSARLRIAIK